MKLAILYQRLAAFILLVAFLAQSFSRVTIVADYYVNKSAYEKLCENKARTAIHCYGKCQMLKKIKQDSKPDEENGEKKSDERTISFFLCNYSNADFDVLSPIIIQAHFYSYPVAAVTDRSFDIFHPPII